ncbi:hypothetical protein ACO0LL_02195 [Undibacterium sp. TC4M20W]|uniref:hypothetical protein n=1 Tax=Undibacterium sp. TC4M20W TaxID=3413052 RepID=UPI003BF1976D
MMQFSLATTHSTANHGISKPGFPAMTVLLVVLAHLLFWQLLRHQHATTRAGENHPLMQYLQLLTIAPKPVTPKASQPVEQPAKPEKPARKETNRPLTASKPARSLVQPDQTAAEIVPDTVSHPSSQTSISPESPIGLGLNLESVRKSAMAMKPTEIEQIQASHRRGDSLEKRLGEGTRRAEKKECLKAYSGIGILAVIPLAVSAVVDTGCKW